MITFIYGMWFGIALTVLCVEFFKTEGEKS